MSALLILQTGLLRPAEKSVLEHRSVEYERGSIGGRAGARLDADLFAKAAPLLRPILLERLEQREARAMRRADIQEAHSELLAQVDRGELSPELVRAYQQGSGQLAEVPARFTRHPGGGGIDYTGLLRQYPFVRAWKDAGFAYEHPDELACVMLQLDAELPHQQRIGASLSREWEGLRKQS